MGGKVLFLLIIAFGATAMRQRVGGLGSRVRLSLPSGPTHGKKVVCYLASWTAQRKDQSQFQVPHFDPSLCTHLVYSFAKLNEKTNSIYSSDIEMDINRKDGKTGYNGFVALKKRLPHLKVTLCIGGWYEGSVKYSKMAANCTARSQFVESVLIFLQAHNFDGLDIMWKYPTIRGGVDEDRENFVTLIKELKEAFQEHKYILTAALDGDQGLANSAYDLVQLNKYLDLIHIMAYDYHGPWDGVVNSNAPLNGTTVKDTRSVEHTIKYMIESGLSPEKMVLGLNLNYRYLVLTDPKVNPVMFGATPVIEKVNLDKKITYNKVCLELKKKMIPWEYNWDEQSSTPYLRDGDNIISYENTRSIANKVKLALDYNLGGFMVWSVDADDFKGLCDIRNDTYKDFETKFQSILEDPDFQDALKNIVLPNLDSHEEDRFYVIENKKLKFNIREPNFPNYQMLRTVNQATSVALDEIKILEELRKFRSIVKKENIVNEWKPKSPDTCVDSSCLSSCIQTCVKKPFIY